MTEELPQVPWTTQRHLISHSTFALRVHTGGGIAREQIPADVGIDYQVEFLDAGKALGTLVGVQVRSGPAAFVDDEIHLAIEAKHKNYWLRYSLPVFIVYFVERENRAFYAPFLPVMLLGPKGQTIRIPRRNVLDENFLSAWRELLLSTDTLRERAKVESFDDARSAASHARDVRLSALYGLIESARTSARKALQNAYSDQLEMLFRQVVTLPIDEAAPLYEQLLVTHYLSLEDLARRNLSNSFLACHEAMIRLLELPGAEPAKALHVSLAGQAADVLYSVAAELSGRRLSHGAELVISIANSLASQSR